MGQHCSELFLWVGKGGSLSYLTNGPEPGADEFLASGALSQCGRELSDSFNEWDTSWVLFSENGSMPPRYCGFADEDPSGDL